MRCHPCRVHQDSQPIGIALTNYPQCQRAKHTIVRRYPLITLPNQDGQNFAGIVRETTPRGALHNPVIPTKVGIYRRRHNPRQSELTSLNPLVFPLGHQGGRGGSQPIIPIIHITVHNPFGYSEN